MSNTPRTDMMENEALAEYRYCELSFNVMRDHARDLERELAAKILALSETIQERDESRALDGKRLQLYQEAMDRWKAFAQTLTVVDANDHGWLRAELESQWRKRVAYVEALKADAERWRFHWAHLNDGGAFFYSPGRCMIYKRGECIATGANQLEAIDAALKNPNSKEMPCNSASSGPSGSPEISSSTSSVGDGTSASASPNSPSGATTRPSSASSGAEFEIVLAPREWIACAERMPEDGQECIWRPLSGIAHAGRYLGGARMGRAGPTFSGVGISMCASVVTEWMPLPPDSSPGVGTAPE